MSYFVFLILTLSKREFFLGARLKEVQIGDQGNTVTIIVIVDRPTLPGRHQEKQSRKKQNPSLKYSEKILKINRNQHYFCCTEFQIFWEKKKKKWK